MNPVHQPGSKRETHGVNSTSRSLLARLRDNEGDAWERLVTLYTPLVYYWSRKSGLPDQEVADVVQDVFRAVSLHIADFRKNRPDDTFRGWLRVITRSKAVDHFRRQAHEPQAAGGTVAQKLLAEVPQAGFHDEHDVVTDDENDAGEQSAQHALFQQALTLIRDDFHEQTWQAFWRVVVDGQAPKDVAEELSMRVGTVRVAKCRVLQRLRRELGDLLE